MNKTNLLVSAVTGLLVTLVLDLCLLFQQMGIMVWESGILFVVMVRLASNAGLEPLSLSLPALRIQMAGAMRHHHNSALHWIVSIMFGLTLTIIFWQSVGPFVAPAGTTIGLANLLAVFVLYPGSIIVFAIATLFTWWLLKHY